MVPVYNTCSCYPELRKVLRSFFSLFSLQEFRKETENILAFAKFNLILVKRYIFCICKI
jgi:hypothetical protein